MSTHSTSEMKVELIIVALIARFSLGSSFVLGARRITARSSGILQSSEELSRLHASLTESTSEVSKGRSVFCNVELNGSQIEAVGFELDHVLAKYNNEFKLLVYEESRAKLVKELGYPAEILGLPFISERVCRGLILDTVKGNVLKVDRHKYVRRAFHGFEEVSDRTIYNCNVPNFSGPNFVNIDTTSMLIDTMLFIHLVDFADRHPEKVKFKTYSKMYEDIRRAVELCSRDGTINRAVMHAPEKYIVPDPELVPMLKQFREAGKKLFLLTNRLWDYTDVVMNFVAGDSQNWLSLFDVTIVGANKPQFLEQDYLALFSVDTRANRIRNVEDKETFLRKIIADPGPKPVLHGGYWQDLHRVLQVSYGDRILYVGDHMYSDILRSKRTLGWRTCLVVPELEHELAVAQESAEVNSKLQQLRHLQRQLEVCSDNLHRRKRERTEAGDNTTADPLLTPDLQQALMSMGELRRAVRMVTSEYDSSFNPYWGQLFKAPHQHSRFAKQVLDYACLYTSRATNLGFASPNKRYRPVLDVFASEAGYYDFDHQ